MRYNVSMIFELLRGEPYKVVFQEQDTVQLRTKAGITVTFAISSDTSRDWIAEAAARDEMLDRYLAPRMMPIMLISPLEAEDRSKTKHDNDGKTTSMGIEELAKIAGVAKEEYVAMARFAQKKLYEGFRARQAASSRTKEVKKDKNRKKFLAMGLRRVAPRAVSSESE